MIQITRMHHFKNITILNPPKSMEDWYESVKYSDERITVFRLHDMIYIDETEQKIFHDDLIKHLNKKEYIESEKLQKWIRNDSNISELISIYDKGQHKELEQEIISKMISFDKDVYKTYINKLKIKYSENEFDSLIHILIETIKTKDISEELLEILRNDFLRDPQDFAVLIQILGLCDNDILSYLYTFYNYFINNFPEENYFEGPLLGISYYIQRRRRTTAST